MVGISAVQALNAGGNILEMGLELLTVRSGQYSFRKQKVLSGDDEYLRLRRPDGTQFNRSNVTTWLTFYFYLVDASSGQEFLQINLGDFFAGSSILKLRSNNTIELIEKGGWTDSADVPISTGTWHKIELEYDENAKTATLYVDGVETVTHPISTGGGNTTTVFNEVIIGGYDPNNLAEYYIDDLVVSESRLDFEPRVIRMGVDGDGNSTDWDASNGYEKVDDVPDDGNTTFITSSTATDKQLVTLEAATSAGVVGNVKAIKTQALVRDEGGASNLATLVRINNTDYDQGEDRDPGNTFRPLGKVLMTNPSNAVAWTISDLNQLQIGVLNNNSVAVRVTAMSAMYSPATATIKATNSGLTRMEKSTSASMTMPFGVQTILRPVSKVTTMTLGITLPQ